MDDDSVAKAVTRQSKGSDDRTGAVGTGAGSTGARGTGAGPGPVLDAGAVIADPAGLSATLMLKEPAYMARWLALEVLLADEAVCADTTLFDKLAALQDQWQAEMLRAYHRDPRP